MGVKVLRNCKANLFLDPELRVKKNIMYLTTIKYHNSITCLVILWKTLNNVKFIRVCQRMGVLIFTAGDIFNKTDAYIKSKHGRKHFVLSVHSWQPLFGSTCRLSLDTSPRGALVINKL